jgi:hypothetical protein
MRTRPADLRAPVVYEPALRAEIAFELRSASSALSGGNACPNHLAATAAATWRPQHED